MSQDQHVIVTLKSALDTFHNVANDDPKRTKIRPYAAPITSLQLDDFFRQRDVENPSLKLSTKLYPIKTLIDLTYKAACETYGLEEAIVQQLYSCLQYALIVGYNIHKEMPEVVELLERTGWCVESILAEQSQIQISKQLSACVCLIGGYITKLCVVYISQGLSTADKLAHQMLWHLIRDACNEYRMAKSAGLPNSHESQKTSYETKTEQPYADTRALARQFWNDTNMFECMDCNRFFGSQNALDQHFDSPAHRFECNDCDRSFGSQNALDQHLDSPAHRFECDNCDRCFGSQNALNQHLNSNAHRLEFECSDCDRCFRSQDALKQHRNSAAHMFARRFECGHCDRCFRNQNALDQHLDSTAHNLECDDCGREFRTEHALDQHYNAVHVNYWR